MVCVKITVGKGSRRYQTSPELCNPTVPFAADRPHRVRPEFFRILFALAQHTRMIHSAAWRYWRLNYPVCSEAIYSDRCGEDCQCFWMAWTTPENCPFRFGDLHPYLIHGSVSPPQSISKPASWSVQSLLHCLPYNVPLLYNGPQRFPQNCPFLLGDRLAHLTHGTYGPLELSSKTASWSV